MTLRDNHKTTLLGVDESGVSIPSKTSRPKLAQDTRGSLRLSAGGLPPRQARVPGGDLETSEYEMKPGGPQALPTLSTVFPSKVAGFGATPYCSRLRFTCGAGATQEVQIVQRLSPTPSASAALVPVL